MLESVVEPEIQKTPASGAVFFEPAVTSKDPRSELEHSHGKAIPSLSESKVRGEDVGGDHGRVSNGKRPIERAGQEETDYQEHSAKGEDGAEKAGPSGLAEDGIERGDAGG